MKESLILADHITRTTYNDLPDNVIDVTKKSLLDGVGVMLAAGSLGEGCRQFAELAMAGGGNEESTIVGFGVKVPVYMAAFAGGAMSHALDFEDTHDSAFVHPNAAAIPAALAVSEYAGNVSGKQLLTALALGSDIVCRMGLALKEDPIKYGWYIPPVLGAFGAATAAGKLLGLSPGQIVDAFSLTLCQTTCSAELTHSPGSLVRAIRDSFSAKAAVLSAQLAQRGITGFECPIEGDAGFFRLYARQDYDITALTEGLGENFEGARVSFKPWPSCRGTHAFIEAALSIAKDNDIRATEIERVILTINTVPVTKALCEPPETKRKPRTAIDAKFSIPYTTAVALVNRDVTLHDFSARAIISPAVLDIARKITVKTDPSLKPHEGFVELITARGLFKAKTPAYVYGHPANPMSRGAMINKFAQCAEYAIKEIEQQEIERVAGLILHIEDIDDISDIIAYL